MAIAVGDISTKGNCKRTICLMTGQTTNNGQPTDGIPSAQLTTGVPNYADPRNLLNGADEGACFNVLSADFSTLVISSSAGSGVMTGTFTLWGYLEAPGKWYPISVNAGAAIGELASPGDTIRYTQMFQQLGHWDRLYLQLAAVGGTGTAFEAFLTTERQGQ